jgi:hypothetical protein
MRRALLGACLALAGCGDPNSQPKLQTGPVEVLNIRRFHCGGTESCATDLLLKGPNNDIWTLHLKDDFSHPPVWPGGRFNIVYIQVPGDEKMRVLWATELK